MLRVTTTWNEAAAAGGGVTVMNFARLAGEGADVFNAVRNFWSETIGRRGIGVQSTTSGAVEVLDEVTGELEDFEVVGGDATSGGTSSGELSPRVNQGLLRFRTQAVRNGRRVQGRLFLPGLTESLIAGGLVTADYRNGYTTAAGGLIAAGLAVYSRPRMVGPIALPGLAVPVSGVSVWDQVAVLRSRRD